MTALRNAISRVMLADGDLIEHVSTLASIADRPAVAGKKTMSPAQVIIDIFHATCSPNALEVLKEVDYDAYLELLTDADKRHSVVVSLMSRIDEFDLQAFPFHEGCKELISALSYHAISSSSPIDKKTVIKLAKALGIQGVSGNQAKLKHMLMPQKGDLDYILSMIVNEVPIDFEKKDFDTSGLKALSKLDQSMEQRAAGIDAIFEEHVHSIEVLLETLKDLDPPANRNEIFTGMVLKSPEVEKILENPRLLTLLSVFFIGGKGICIYHELGLTRQGFSDLEVAALTRYCVAKSEGNKWFQEGSLNGGLRKAIALHQASDNFKKSIDILNRSHIETFSKVFKSWFTSEYQASVKWNHSELKGAKLEDDFGL